MILRINANLETLYTTQPPPSSSSSFCLSEISDKKQVFTWIIQRVYKFVYTFIWEGWWGGGGGWGASLLSVTCSETGVLSFELLAHSPTAWLSLPFKPAHEPHLFSCGELLLRRACTGRKSFQYITGSAQKYVFKQLPQHRFSVTCDETTQAFSVEARDPSTKSKRLARLVVFFCLASRRETNHAEH